MYTISLSLVQTHRSTLSSTKKLYICVALCCLVLHKAQKYSTALWLSHELFCCFYCCVASFFLLMVAHIILHRNSVYYLCMVLCCVVLCWVSLHHQPRRLCTFNEHKQIAICKRYRHTTQLYPPSIHARSVHSSV